MRPRVLVSLLAVVASWALAAPTHGSANVADHFCLVLNTPSTIANPAQTAQRNAYVVLQAWEAKRAAALKAANPKLSVLVYQNLSSMDSGTGSGGLYASGVSYAEANVAHPGWFLRDTAGNRIVEDSYSWLWMADIGVPGYQQKWTANVLRTLQNGPWDGVLMDDTNTTPKYHVDPSRIAAYPTDKAYQGAVRSMLAYAGPRIMAAGKLAIPNMGSWSEYPKVVEGWLPFVSGGMDEMFVKWSTTPGQGFAGPRVWRRQVEEIEVTERMGKRFLAVTHAVASDAQAYRYGWASTLLGASGSTAYFAGNEYHGDTWSSDYDIQLGSPTSGPISIANGAWKRTFTKGIVVVNPTTSKLSVGFGGTYSGSGLVNATGGTLAPHTALILSSGTPPPAGSVGGSGEGGSPEGAPPQPPATEPASSEEAVGPGAALSPAAADSAPVSPEAEPAPAGAGKEARRCRRVLKARRAGRRELSPRRLRRCQAVVRASARGSRAGGEPLP